MIDPNEILLWHVNLGKEKSVSYLPINTIKNVIKIEVADYLKLLEQNGNRSIVFSEEECCIKSGAVYGFNERSLFDLLSVHRNELSKLGFPIKVDDFILWIASDWQSEASPAMPIIKAAFGN